MANGTLKTLAWTTPLALTAAAVGGAALLRRHFRATPFERHAWLPGDELIDSADAQNDRAVTIDTPPASVWPWIAQLGQTKAGFYSFEFLENAMGCEIDGVSRINPDWQHVSPDDELRLHPELALRVALVEPGEYLVATSMGGEAPDDPGFHMSWGFYLSEIETEGALATRLHVRERYYAERPNVRPALRVIGSVSAVMTWRMLGRLRKLASRDAAVSS